MSANRPSSSNARKPTAPLRSSADVNNNNTGGRTSRPSIPSSSLTPREQRLSGINPHTAMVLIDPTNPKHRYRNAHLIATAEAAMRAYPARASRTLSGAPDPSSSRNRPTLMASRRRGGATATRIVPSGPMADINRLIRTPNLDSPNHNNDRQASAISQRTGLQSYNNSLRHRDETPAARRRPSRNRSLSLSVSNLKNQKASIKKVLVGSEKYLPKIFQFLNWNELLPMRYVCKKWLEVISTNPQVSDQLGVIVITSTNWEDQLQLFNESPVIWTKFKIEANLFIDLMDSIQLQFWMKHGPMMKWLEIKNKSMSLTGLVEVLSRCPNLSHFLVRWTPEMYPFNAELIKKYYGYNFYNGTFANMRELSVERSCYLNDNALMSMLKWCGGPLKSISLTYPPEKEQNPLTRLKPRWTIQPLKNYIERFGYTANLQYLDFSWSNISPMDMHVLAELENLSMLKGISLNHCKLDDKSMTYFLVKKGAKLEKLEVESVPLTHAIFGETEIKQVSVPRLKSLNISGPQGVFQHTFLHHLQNLEELKASNTSWLDYGKLMPALKSKGKQTNLRSVDISGNIKVDGSKLIDNNMSRIWITNLATALSHVVRLNLSGWTKFGKNDNFRIICQLMPLIEELRLRGWKDLNDVGVTGLTQEKLHSENILIVSKEQKKRIFVGSLKSLHTLDLSDSKISDASIKYGINSIPCLRKFAFEHTQVSDIGVNAILTENQTIDKISFTGCNKMIHKKPSKLPITYQRLDGRIIRTGPI